MAEGKKKGMGILAYAFAEVANVVVRIFEKKDSGLILYGEDNQLPEKMDAWIDSSGVASECVDKIKTFLIAGGFTNEGVKNFKCNPNETLSELFSYMCNSWSRKGGVYLNIQCSLVGDVEHVYVLPYNEMRVKSDGSFVRKKDWKNAKVSDDDLVYPAFTDDVTKRVAEIKKQLAKNKNKQLGFVAYIFNKADSIDKYSKPKWLSNPEDIESDAALQVLERRNIKKGFKTNVIISTIGEINDTDEDENGKTDYDYWQDGLRSFTTEDAPGILHLYGKTANDLPRVDQFDVAAMLDGIDKARDRAGRKVCTAFGVPAILCGFQQPEGWGNSQALANSTKLFSEAMEWQRAMILSGLKKIFPKLDLTVKQLSLVKYVPENIIDSLTNDEKRQLAGYDALPSTGGSTTSLSDRLGIGNTTNLMTMLKDPLLSPEQKKNQAIHIFGVSESVAIDLTSSNSNPNPPEQ